ncbi:MAG: helix-turn-helix domain-containing protein [Oscillospiraceae bacterium]|nr:helix-turn-helix domain-containing protein [Oscillospiraceae bacterium]
MDTIKIGKFLAELRRERELTQEQLAQRLGTSNKTISRWENGNYMPPVEMFIELSEFYGVSINEIISGKRLEEPEEKQAAEENLKEVLSVSAFTVEERKKYFTKKWKTEHSFGLTIRMLACLAIVIIGLFLEEIIIVLVGEFICFATGIINYNRMMTYVEKNSFDVKNSEDDKKS